MKNGILKWWKFDVALETNCAIRSDSMTTEQLLIALASKFQEIADNTTDVETESELNELIEKIYESVF